MIMTMLSKKDARMTFTERLGIVVDMLYQSKYNNHVKRLLSQVKLRFTNVDNVFLIIQFFYRKAMRSNRFCVIIYQLIILLSYQDCFADIGWWYGIPVALIRNQGILLNIDLAVVVQIRFDDFAIR